MMKRNTLLILMIICLGIAENIHAQCAEVVFPFCPLVNQATGQFDLDLEGGVLPCTNTSLSILTPPTYGTVVPMVNGNLDGKYQLTPDTTSTCINEDLFVALECCDNGMGGEVCDTVMYLIHYDYECETPEDLFCCITPDMTNFGLDVLVNDTMFIEENYNSFSYEIEIDTSSFIGPTNGLLGEGPFNPFTYTPDMGFTGLDSFSYLTTYTIITTNDDTITICDRQNCYIQVDDCLSTQIDEACAMSGETICIDPIANDMIESPTYGDPPLDTLSCSNVLPVINPASLTQPMPLNGAPPLTDGGNGSWCFVETTPGSYAYTYDICTDAGQCETESMIFTVKPDCIFEDYVALRALYLSTDGDNWANNTGWPDAATFLANPTSPSPSGYSGFENWYGVTTDATTECVTDIYLQDNNLNGTIPDELGNLGSLTYLNLAVNQLINDIPAALGNLTNLTYLDLSDNQLIGYLSAALGNLGQLNILDVRNNLLTGCFDTNLLNLCNQLAAALVDTGNSFDATWQEFCDASVGICSAYSACRQLDSLVLVDLYNDTNGANWTNTWDLNQSMDSWYGITLNANGCVNCIDMDGNFDCIDNFNATGNNLSGSIPTTIGSLSNLLFLNLNYNNISGNIPTELENLSSLTYLRLNSNELIGNIPNELGNMYNLTLLYLYNNDLSGSIPPELGNLHNLMYLSLSINNLSGSIPAELGDLNNLILLNLNLNELVGGIPLEFGNLSNLTTLSLYTNQLSGCYDANLQNLCGQLTNNPNNISSSNSFDATWAGFCSSAVGICYCPLNDNINGTTPSNTYQAAQTLTSSAEVLSGENVMFKAGELINLDTGFVVLPNATFSGEIESCTPQ